jgi:hypothetical protein
MFAQDDAVHLGGKAMNNWGIFALYFDRSTGRLCITVITAALHSSDSVAAHC